MTKKTSLETKFQARRPRRGEVDLKIKNKKNISINGDHYRKPRLVKMLVQTWPQLIHLQHNPTLELSTRGSCSFLLCAQNRLQWGSYAAQALGHFLRPLPLSACHADNRRAGSITNRLLPLRVPAENACIVSTLCDLW